MGSLEYLQMQLQKEYYSLTINDDLTDGDKAQFYDETVTIEKLKDYNQHRLVFEKVLSNYYYTNDWKYSYRREMQQILPGLYVGGYSTANKSKKNYLLKHGITHIICIHNETESNWIKPQFSQDFTYLTLNIDDTYTQNIIPFFELTNRFILDTLRKNGKILVHSNAGISRSATIVIAFIMFYFNCNSKKASTFVQNFRFCIFPNESFRLQLLEYEPIVLAESRHKKGCLNLNRKRSLSEDYELNDEF